MGRERILITISFSFTIRYIIRTGLLQQLREFVEPIIVLTWREDNLIMELKTIGIEVHVFPESKMGVAYGSARKKIDIWFNHFKMIENSGKIQRRYLAHVQPLKSKMLSDARKWYNISKFYWPGNIEKIFNREKVLVQSDTNYSQLSALVDDLNVHAVFTVTPFHRQEDILLRVCKDKGKKMITAILSFDNITKRGWIPVEYDLYMVWNKFNKEELQTIYPFTKTKPVYITGAPQFDFYFDKSYLLEKENWEKEVGLFPKKRKIILYAGGPKSLFPQEPQYLKQIDTAISTGAIKNKPVILFRCHPIDNIERWKEVVGESENIIFDKSWTGKENLGYANITDNDIRKLCSTLAYTDVHINICSTMTVDGSAFNKPQIGPAYIPEDKKGSTLLQEMYSQKHFKPIVETNGLALAKSSDELINHINNALEHPENYTLNNRKILKTIISFCDGTSMLKVADIIKKVIVT